MKIGILAGEPSGDLLGSGLIKKLREWYPEASFEGIGGPLMMAEGINSLFPMERLSVMGFYEPLKRLPELLKIRRTLIKYFIETPPDIFIGIDSPDFNLGVELKLRQNGIPVVHYVSPSVWAWRRKRIFKIAKATDLVLTLFPFEMDFYHENQVPAQFVGHPLADAIPIESDKWTARRLLGLEPEGLVIAVLPGSRHSEIQYMGDLFVETAKKCFQQKPQLTFITSSINEARDQEIKAIFARLAPELPIQFFVRQSHAVIAASDLVLVTSGTATFETMLFKRPMVIAYRMGRFSFQIAKRLIKVPFIGLPNLLAKERLVPEFIQDAATPEILSNALLDFLNHPETMYAIEEKFTMMHHALRRDANLEAALAIRDILKRKNKNELSEDGRTRMGSGD